MQPRETVGYVGAPGGEVASKAQVPGQTLDPG